MYVYVWRHNIELNFRAFLVLCRNQKSKGWFTISSERIPLFQFHVYQRRLCTTRINMNYFLECDSGQYYHHGSCRNCSKGNWLMRNRCKSSGCFITDLVQIHESTTLGCSCLFSWICEFIPRMKTPMNMRITVYTVILKFIYVILSWSK